MASNGKKRNVLPSSSKKGSLNDGKSESLRSKLNKGSETAFDFYCDLCYKDNNYVEAVGYCSDCKDYLCQECYNYHLKPKPSQHHVLLDQHRMPKAMSQRQSKDMCTEPCAEHKNKILEYYCADHKKFGCGVCMTLHHRNCEGVDYIPDIAGDVLTSREYKDMNLTLRGLINTAQQAINTTQQKTQTSNQQHSDASECFKQMKKDLIAAVDIIETLTMTDAGKIRDENQKKMKSVENQCNQLLMDIGALDSKFTSLENKGQHCLIFFSMKRSQDEITSFETSLLQLQDQSNITEYVIRISQTLQNLIQQPESMASLEIIKDPQMSAQAHSISSSRPKTQQKSVPGHTKPKIQPTAAASTAVRKPEEHEKSEPDHIKPKIQSSAASTAVREPEEHEKAVPDHIKPKIQSTAASTAVRESEEHKNIAAVHVADIGVMMEDDRNVPCITGSVVLPGDKLVIADYNNNTVKLINLQSNKIVAHLRYDSKLWDITSVTPTQVAVSCPLDNTILLINVTNKLTLDRKVKVKGECMGIASISDKLVITYRDPVKVEIISQKGKLLQTVVTEDRGRQLFTSNYVTVSPDQQTLYISDYERGTVTSLDLSGQVKATYKDEELKQPCGLTVDRAGGLYVCGYWSHSTHQLTPDLHKVQILLQESDNIESPISVSYNEEQNKLYIGMWNNYMVKVYLLQSGN